MRHLAGWLFGAGSVQGVFARACVVCSVIFVLSGSPWGVPPLVQAGRT